MAIKVTVSELKRYIRESIQECMKEDGACEEEVPVEEAVKEKGWDKAIEETPEEKGWEKASIEEMIDQMVSEALQESKPSAGLSKKERSSVVKKAKKGEDIGKKGKGFDKVAKAAGGGEKGKKIAAASM